MNSDFLYSPRVVFYRVARAPWGDFLSKRLHLPLCECATDIYFGQRLVAQKFEHSRPCSRVRDDPVADLIAAVAGCAERLLECRRNAAFAAILEYGDARAIELFID